MVVRRVDASWSDPLDLRPKSRLGVVGLTEACRRGTVTVVNPLGSGILESPGMLPFLPQLARAILGETLKLESVPTHWCGNDSERSHVLAHFEQMVLRPTDRGRSVFPALLTREQQESWRERVSAEPFRWVGQEHTPFSEAPMAAPQGLAAGQVSMRLFSVAHGSGYVSMPGALGRVQDGDPSIGGRGRVSVAKDVWVRSGRTDPAARGEGRVWLYEGPVVQPDRPESTSSPRVLEDLYWLGPVRRADRGPHPAADRRAGAGGGFPVPSGASRCGVRAGAAVRGEHGVRDGRVPARLRPVAADPRTTARHHRDRHRGTVSGGAAGVGAVRS